MKEAKKVQITQQICEQIRLMRRAGANQTEIGKLMGISAPTISRIESAAFDLEKYLENKRTAREKEKKGPELMAEGTYEWKTGDEFPGQLRMDLHPAEEQKTEMSDQVKLMRFLAGQVDKLYMKLDTINNTVSQILRATRVD